MAPTPVVAPFFTLNGPQRRTAYERKSGDLQINLGHIRLEDGTVLWSGSGGEFGLNGADTAAGKLLARAAASAGLEGPELEWLAADVWGALTHLTVGRIIFGGKASSFTAALQRMLDEHAPTSPVEVSIRGIAFHTSTGSKRLLLKLTLVTEGAAWSRLLALQDAAVAASKGAGGFMHKRLDPNSHITIQKYLGCNPSTNSSTAAQYQAAVHKVNEALRALQPCAVFQGVHIVAPGRENGYVVSCPDHAAAGGEPLLEKFAILVPHVKPGVYVIGLVPKEEDEAEIMAREMQAQAATTEERVAFVQGLIEKMRSGQVVHPKRAAVCQEESVASGAAGALQALVLEPAQLVN